MSTFLMLWGNDTTLSGRVALIVLVVTFSGSSFDPHERVKADVCWKEDTNEGMMILIE